MTPRNIYPTERQLSDIVAAPLSYDLNNKDFRNYWESRTGCTWTGVVGFNSDGTCIDGDITEFLIQQDNKIKAGEPITMEHANGKTSKYQPVSREKWRLDGTDYRHWYQHAWNIWHANKN